MANTQKKHPHTKEEITYFAIRYERQALISVKFCKKKNNEKMFFLFYYDFHVEHFIILSFYNVNLNKRKNSSNLNSFPPRTYHLCLVCNL